jgi:hypothetical protein
MKQQPVVTHQYTILQEKEKTLTVPSQTTLKYVKFLQKYMEKHFFFGGYQILTEGVFVNQLSNNAGKSV